MCLRLVARTQEREAQYHPPVAQALREDPVVLQLRTDPLQLPQVALVVAQRSFGQLVQHGETGALVTFGEHYVEAHRLHLVAVEQLVDDRRQGVARPGPAAHCRETALVDVENHDAVVDRAGQRPLQAEVVRQVLQLVEQRHRDQAHRVADEHRHDHEAQQDPD